MWLKAARCARSLAASGSPRRRPTTNGYGLQHLRRTAAPSNQVDACLGLSDNQSTTLVLLPLPHTHSSAPRHLQKEKRDRKTKLSSVRSVHVARLMSGSVVWVVSPKETSRSSGFSQFAGVKRRWWRSSSAGWSCARSASTARRSVSASLVVTPPRSSEALVYDVVLRQAALVGEARRKRAVEAVEAPPAPLRGDLLDAAYERCGEVCAEYAKTFYLGNYETLDLQLAWLLQFIHILVLPLL